MINHLYWNIVSTSDGNGEMMKAKWLSLVNHLHNDHSGHSELFPNCSHGNIAGREKKWLKQREYKTFIYFILLTLTLLSILNFRH